MSTLMQSKARKALLLTGITAVLLCAPQAASMAGIKCWTNDEGVRECGDRVPPEYAQQGHEVLNETGVTVKEQERAKTEAEIEAEKRRRELEAERERRERERAARDRVLLATFATEDDLLLARDSRIGAIDARIAQIREILANLEDSRERLRAKAAGEERSGRSLSEKLQQDLADLREDVQHHRDAIAKLEAEKEEIRARFAKDLARYRELKNRQAKQ